MHGVLQPLDELLEVLDASYERTKVILVEGNAGNVCRLGSRLVSMPGPADPLDQRVTPEHPLTTDSGA
jgi:hypothetical protein